MPRTFDCSYSGEREEGLAAAVAAIGAGQLVVLPTDTVYGIAADAFSPDAVAELLRAKGRGRDMPVPVLIGSQRTLDGIATEIPEEARHLVDAFWPGPLTIICRQQPSLRWDIGDSRGTVAVRMPQHPIAIELLQATGPLAVSSANVSGQPPATEVAEALEQLGSNVEIYLDDGPTSDAVPSSIVDVTGDFPRLVREGALPLSVLRSVAPDMEGPE